jgi:hypothetical protein
MAEKRSNTRIDFKEKYCAQKDNTVLKFPMPNANQWNICNVRLLDPENVSIIHLQNISK